MSARGLDERRTTLEGRWLVLTRTVLPSMAGARGWPIARDHCFQRVLLDTACAGCWYDHIAGRPAYRAATDTQLAIAVGLAERLIDNQVDLAALNRQSLRWRGKG